MKEFCRAAYFLDDYCDILKSYCIVGDNSESDRQSIAMVEEMQGLATRLKTMAKAMAASHAYDKPHQAAKIVADIMNDWKLPGAVWYSPRIKRFRIAGEGYTPKPSDVCCGVYLPGADFNMLADDFEEIMRGTP